jgi:hypothetical protein
MKHAIFLSTLCAALGIASAATEPDCGQLALEVKATVSSEPANLLEIVAARVSASPGCACEVVKTAIEVSKADAATVSAIVESAITAAPDQMRLIAQCAIAVAPDSLVQVQALLAKLDPNSGDAGDSAKSAKGEKAPIGEVAAMPNPLDFPGKGPVKPLFPIFPPVIINPPNVTNVNPFRPNRG